jgi:hypothetical protein
MSATPLCWRKHLRLAQGRSCFSRGLAEALAERGEQHINALSNLADLFVQAMCGAHDHSLRSRFLTDAADPDLWSRSSPNRQSILPSIRTARSSAFRPTHVAKYDGGEQQFWFLMILSSPYIPSLMHRVDFITTFPGTTIPPPAAFARLQEGYHCLVVTYASNR